MSTLSRTHELVRRLGPVGAAKRAALRLLPGTSWAEEMVWMALDVTDPDRPRRRLDETFVVRRGSLDDMWLLDQIPSDQAVAQMTPALVQERLAAGSELWLTVEDDRLAFRCWIFRGWAPAPGAPHHRVPLPDDVVLLEDSIASPEFRGRGVAPGTWSALGDAFAAEEGVRTIITKIAQDNEVTQRSIEKVGFRAVATMRMSGPVWRMRVAITPAEGPDGDRAAWLRSSMAR
ncbi:hypothetical protein [Geodermatophilus sp. URMC 63]